jgi:hypothetical protein
MISKTGFAPALPSNPADQAAMPSNSALNIGNLIHVISHISQLPFRSWVPARMTGAEL